MSTGRRRSALSYIPGLSENSVLKLIIFLASAYVIFAIIWAIVALLYQGDTQFYTHFIPAVALPQISVFTKHWWTIFTSGLLQSPNGFWELLSNMLWLYCFGSVVQMLVGHRQVIPLYLYSLLVGGVFYMVAQLLPGVYGRTHYLLYLGPRAGLIGLAAAAFTLTPKYQFYLTETFRVPIIVVAGIFTALMVLNAGLYTPDILMLAGGALTGFGYIKLLQAGYRPGEWMYNLTGKVESLVTPDENALRKKQGGRRYEMPMPKPEARHGISQKRIDDILDKINQKGYNALSAEEKETLMRAGKDQ